MIETTGIYLYRFALSAIKQNTVTYDAGRLNNHENQENKHAEQLVY